MSLSLDTRRHSLQARSILAPIFLIGALSVAIAFQSGIVWTAPADYPEPQTITIPPAVFDYRLPGEYYRDGYAVDAPKATVTMAFPLTITKYQVSTQAYDTCVAEGACAARDSKTPSRTDMPVTGVSHDDATAYARWLSSKNGVVWRLPTDQEIAYAAGKRFPDDALGVDPGSRNPALRWLADYERETARKRSRDSEPLPYGNFGESESGLADFGGNIWEWTTTCNRRVDLAYNGRSVSSESCGVYISVGRHRAPLSSFIRDPKSGGCSVGVPPDHVGFRLVKDPRWYAPLLFALYGR